MIENEELRNFNFDLNHKKALPYGKAFYLWNVCK